MTSEHDTDIAPEDRALSPSEEVKEGEREVSVAEQAVEADLELARLAKERDEYLDALRRLQADFENYKKRMLKQQTDYLERAAQTLVDKLLPVLDTVDLAVAHGGGEAVEQIWSALNETLGKEGLQRIDSLVVPFDPTEHAAVLHEPGEDPPAVVDVMRAGYRW